MAEFDINKVLTPFDAQEKDLTGLYGKEFYCSDNLISLKEEYETKDEIHKGILEKVCTFYNNPFLIEGNNWQFIYPVEEREIRPMTEEEILEWFKLNRPVVYVEETSNLYSVLGFLGFVFDDDGSVSKYTIGDCTYSYETFIKYAHKYSKDGSKFEIEIKE